MNAASCACGSCGQVTCGCCSGIEVLTPELTANRPGLTSLHYRIGTHGSFLESMKARLGLHELHDTELPDKRPLANLTTRDASDASIAFLDAWACVGDVLTFYQERIANEGYLRTATELRSLYELARLVGYRPRPGVAASVYLSYTIDDHTTTEVLIPKGARSQSVPDPGDLPQSFETSEDLKARAKWNRLRVRTHQPQRLASIQNNGRVYIKSVSTNLSPNDPLLVVESEKNAYLFRITEVVVDTEHGETRLGVAPWEKQSAAATALASLRHVSDVLDNAPTPGVTADRIVAALEPLRKAVREAGAAQLVSTRVLDEAHFTVLTELRGMPGGATHLRPWAEQLESALSDAQALRLALDEPDGAAAAVNSVASLDANVLIERLSRAPSQPRPNALQLPRSLEDSFRPSADAGLQVLGALSPRLKETLGPALAGQSDVAQTLAVYAFRVRAGVFGRNAQPIQELRRDDNGGSTKTKIISEWPIIEQEALAVPGDRETKANVIAIHEDEWILWLDNSYDGIAPASWIAIDSSAATVSDANRVQAAKQLLITRPTSVHSKITRREYGLSADTTRLTLRREDPWLQFRPEKPPIGKPLLAASAEVLNREFSVIRGTTVFARAERLPLAEEPITAELCGGTVTGERASAQTNRPVELDGLYQDLEPGRFVVVSGERAQLGDATVVRASEAVMIRSVIHDIRAADDLLPWSDGSAVPAGSAVPPKLPGDTIHTFVWFDRPLSYCYRRNTVQIHANVVKATHGETRRETLGSGAGSQALQSFALKQSPVTYLAAPTAVGAESTLQVFVNDVRWHEQDTFVDRSPVDHIFVTKMDDEGKSTVMFGNGREGARLPTGIGNVQAEYRFGIGKGGNVRPERITTLSTRPVGVREVINPLRASGGADREGRDRVRRNAPNAVRSLDRLVATRDYGDFARTFAGIGKAAAVELSDGSRTVVHVTIAGDDDIPIDRDSDLFLNLRRALRDLGDPFQPVQLAVRELLLLIVSAGIRIDPDYRWEVVVSAVRARLLETFGFERRDLGQDAARSEVLSVMQSVPGVLYVDLDTFGRIETLAPDGTLLTPDQITAKVRDLANKADVRVAVEMARFEAGAILPAQLAVLTADVPATLVLNRIE